jgi:hypothetical protein
MKIQTTFEGKILTFTEQEFKTFVYDVMQQAIVMCNLSASVKQLRKSVGSQP